MCSASRSLAKSRNGLLIRSGALTVAMFLLAAPLRAAARPPSPVGWTNESAKPRVLIVSLPGCPLLISGVDDSRLTAHHLELSFFVLNIGAQPITSYTIRYSEYRGESPAGSGDTSSSWGVLGPKTFNFPPGQWNDEVIGVTNEPEAIDRVELAVDFVEFTDRTVWGPDLDRNGQMLAGMRDGAAAAQAYLKQTLEARGSIGLMTAIVAEHLPLEPDQNNERSVKNSDWQQWIRGYRLGRDTIKRKVKQAMESGGGSAAAAVLNQPIDPPAETSK